MPMAAKSVFVSLNYLIVLTNSDDVLQGGKPESSTSLDAESDSAAKNVWDEELGVFQAQTRVAGGIARLGIEKCEVWDSWQHDEFMKVGESTPLPPIWDRLALFNKRARPRHILDWGGLGVRSKGYLWLQLKIAQIRTEISHSCSALNGILCRMLRFHDYYRAVWI